MMALLVLARIVCPACRAPEDHVAELGGFVKCATCGQWNGISRANSQPFPNNKCLNCGRHFEDHVTDKQGRQMCPGRK